MGAIREGRWDCAACGNTGIRGRERACPECGRPRALDVKFYLPENEPEITDARLLQEARAGPDWHCQHCGAGNSSMRTACKQCGAAKGSSPSHKVTEYGLDDVPHSGDAAPAPPVPTFADLQAPADSAASAVPAPAPPGATFADVPGGPGVAASQSTAGRGCGLAAAIVGVLGVIGLFVALLLRSPFTRVTVSGFSRERTITVEQLRTRTEQGWSIPSGGRLISETQAVHHSEAVLDHYDTKQRQVCENVREGYEITEYEDCKQVQAGAESYVCGHRDLGNGEFEDIMCERPLYEKRCTPATRQVPKYVKKCHEESYQDPIYRQEPRYATRYTYKIDRWEAGRTVRASERDHEAYWPALQLAADEREAGRTESYTVIFTDRAGRSYEYDCPLKAWSDYQEQEQLRVKIDESGVVPQ